MAQIVGVLVSPTGEPMRAVIRLTSLGGSCLATLNTYFETGLDGVYDFNLLNGKYQVEVLQCREFEHVGEVEVTDNTPSPTTLTTLLGSQDSL